MSRGNSYLQYYRQQVGSGLNVYAGPHIQRGHGLGSWFKSLIRYITPLIKPAAKAVGGEALRLGGRVYHDIQEGQDPEQAVKRNLRVSGRNLLNKAGDNLMTAQFGSGRRRKRKAVKSSCSKKRKIKRRVKTDFLE